ncbi:MAG TPA: hypothetical protein VGF25_07950 [Thermoleophilaceae bacterium]|jgi:hypothetical protein
MTGETSLITMDGPARGPRAAGYAAAAHATVWALTLQERALAVRTRLSDERGENNWVGVATVCGVAFAIFGAVSAVLPNEVKDGAQKLIKAVLGGNGTTPTGAPTTTTGAIGG